MHSLINSSTNKEIFSTKELNYVDDQHRIFKISDSYMSSDWTKEPIESFEELKKRRAEQLREKYSYLVLYFSGGADSTTMVNAFLKNNIHVDEIVTAGFVDVGKPNLDGRWAQHYLFENGFKGKHTFIELTANVLAEMYRSEKWKEEYPDFPGLPHVISRFRVDFFEEYSIIESIRRKGIEAHVYAERFPVIFFKDRTYYALFAHKFLPIWSRKENKFHEPFFSSESFPALDIKQHHIFARTWDKNRKSLHRMYLSDGTKDSYATKFIIRDRIPEIMYGDNKGLGVGTSISADKTEPSILFNFYRKNKTFLDAHQNTLTSLENTEYPLNEFNRFKLAPTLTFKEDKTVYSGIERLAAFKLFESSRIDL